LKLAFDTNVVLDVLLDRAPFGESARDLWTAVEKGKVEAVLAGHAFTTVWYLVAQARGAAAARGVVALVARVFGVAAVDQPVVRRALELEFRDFEDSVCAAAAEAAGCDLIVTRNRKDFARSPVTAVDPVTALALVEGGGSGEVSEQGAVYGRPRSRVSARRSGRDGGARARR